MTKEKEKREKRKEIGAESSSSRRLNVSMSNLFKQQYSKVMLSSSYNYKARYNY